LFKLNDVIEVQEENAFFIDLRFGAFKFEKSMIFRVEQLVNILSIFITFSILK
jgi:hypothetical protein